MKDKELEKLEKYQLLKVRRMRKVIVVPFVIGALGAVSVNFKEYMKRIGVNVRLDVIQKTALLGTAKILRDGPLENLWGGRAKYKKKFAQGKIK